MPVEPTPEMYRTSREVTESEGIVTTTWLRSAVYQAMIEAAPQPPKLSDERILELFHANNLGGIPSAVRFARAVEREILGGDEK